MDTILIVDDEPGLRFAVRRLLEAESYAVAEAADGREGIAAALQHPPALILCDIEMPQMNGFEMLKELRQHESTKAIPFIFLTGKSYTTHGRDGMDIGADDFITKPFSAESLLTTIRIRLNRLNVFEDKARKQIEDFRSNITLTLPHELRTPLNTMIGMAEVLRKRSGQLRPVEIQELAEGMYTSAGRLHHTLENFWAYVRVELLGLEKDWALPAVMVRVDQLLAMIALRAAKQYDRNGDLELQTDPVSVCIEQEYFERILSELLDNAFKFSEPGTKVRVVATAGDGIVTVQIEDRGRGMSREELSRIGAFMQFERRLHEQQGMGLGFAIAKRLVELHKGTVDVHSESGNGTTVTLVFPGLRFGVAS